MNSAVSRPFPPARRGTWTFLHSGARRTCHVHLLADVDAGRMRRAREESGGRLSYVSLVVKAAADVVAGYPEARSVLRGSSWRPRLAELADVDVKVLFDKVSDGRRCVVSGVVPAAQRLTPAQVQDVVDVHKNAGLGEPGPYRQALRLQRLPVPLSRLLFRAAMRDPVRRSALQGTFSVTSVGHEPVRAILPMIYGTLGFGMGRIADAAVVRDGRVCVAPQFTLSLAFDHRVVDGALAAEVLGRVKERLEGLGGPDGGTGP